MPGDARREGDLPGPSQTQPLANGKPEVKQDLFDQEDFESVKFANTIYPDGMHNGAA